MKSPIPTQPAAVAHSVQSGQEVAKSSRPTTPTAKPQTRRRLPRSHADYWRARLCRPSYTYAGHTRLVNDLAVRIQHGGRRELLTLGTTNTDAAAVKARDLFRAITENGWASALAKFYPDSDGARRLNLSVGEFLSTVRAAVVPSPLRLRTFLGYANCFRTIVSEAFGVKGGKAKYDYKTGGHAKWIEKIDAIRLERVTPDIVIGWKKQRLARAGNSPVALASAKRTVNSYIRQSRSLFAPTLLAELKGVQLPAVLPFAGVTLEDAGSMKYISKVNAHALIAAARNELKSQQPEAYKVFLLGLFAGLRKAEVDSLEWRMVDFGANVIKLEETDFLHLKTSDSAAEITADPEMIAELRSLMPATAGPFVVSSEIKFRKRARGGREFEFVHVRPARNDSARPYYRAAPVFEALNAWLRSKGIMANKPLHELRKELGAIVATEHGIFAAKEFLRHSDITTTARHYADHKKRISVGLGKLLQTEIKPVARKRSSRAA